jgi:hypothetical protein
LKKDDKDDANFPAEFEDHQIKPRDKNFSSQLNSNPPQRTKFGDQ